MIKPKVLVMGATGKTGGALVDELLAREIPVRALVRTRDGRSASLESRGAEVAVADIFDTDQLIRAMRGTHRAYYLPPIHAYAIQSAVAFAEAARETKLEAMVQMGQWLSHRDHPSIMTRQTYLMDKLFSRLPDTAHTILNPGMFADNFLRVIDYAALLGIFPNLTGDSKVAPVSNEDMARVAAAVLSDSALHAGKIYRPTGPTLLCVPEMAAVASKVLGRKVRPVSLPWWMFTKVARQQGVDPQQISGFRHYVEDMKRGAFAFEGGVTQTVEALTGKPAETFEATTRRYAAMPFARRTTGNQLRAILNFMIIPMIPGYDLERFDDARGFPMPTEPSLSIDDDVWRTEHKQIMAEQPRPEYVTSPSGVEVGAGINADRVA